MIFYQVLIILDLTMMKTGGEVNSQIGNPIPYDITKSKEENASALPKESIKPNKPQLNIQGKCNC